jgi:hypothetical protein
MRPIAALERFLERLFERPSARLFRAPLQPIQLQRRVERAMELGRVNSADRTVVPDRFVIRLDPGDLEAFGGLARDLADELADAALRFARTHGYTLRERPRVDLIADPLVDRGDPQVEARFGRHEPAGGAEARLLRSAGIGVGRPDASRAAEARPSDLPTVSPTGPERAYLPPVPSGPRASVRVLEPTGADRRILVDGRGLTIGRDPDNELVIGDPAASRHHARLVARQGLLVLEDLDSRNGTSVNGERVGSMAVGLGDEIRVGETRLVIEAPPT